MLSDLNRKEPRVAAKIRPGIHSPDWSVVTKPAAREASATSPVPQCIWQQPPPLIMFGGASDGALEMGAAERDLFAIYAEPRATRRLPLVGSERAPSLRGPRCSLGGAAKRDQGPASARGRLIRARRGLEPPARTHPRNMR